MSDGDVAGSEAARVRRRFAIECALALVSIVLLLATLVSREWIEIVFGVDPDRGSGALEWLLVACFVATTTVFALLARVDRRRLQAWRARLEDGARAEEPA